MHKNSLDEYINSDHAACLPAACQAAAAAAATTTTSACIQQARLLSSIPMLVFVCVCVKVSCSRRHHSHALKFSTFSILHIFVCNLRIIKLQHSKRACNGIEPMHVDVSLSCVRFLVFLFEWRKNRTRGKQNAITFALRNATQQKQHLMVLRINMLLCRFSTYYYFCLM